MNLVFGILFVLACFGALWTRYSTLDLERKLQDIGSPKYFFVCPSLINLYHSCQDIGAFSPKGFHDSIDFTNRILEIIFILEQDPRRAEQLLKDTTRLKNNALNSFHKIAVNSFDPSDMIIQEKLSTALGILDKTLTGVIRDAYRTMNVPLDRGPGPVHVDQSASTFYDFFNSPVSEVLTKTSLEKLRHA